MTDATDAKGSRKEVREPSLSDVRTLDVRIKVTAAEKRFIQAIAQARRLTVSDLIRGYLALPLRVDPRPAPADASRETLAKRARR